MQKKFGAFSSSEDPEKLASTVKGLIVGGATLIIFLASKFGFEISTEQVTQIAIDAGMIVSTIWTLYGLLKKVIVRFTKKTE